MKFTHQNFLNLKGDPDILVEQWHTTYSQQDLHTFMGLSAEEYAVWATNPCIVDLAAFLRGQVPEFSIEWDDSLAIAPYPVWVCWYECYMHVAGSVQSLYEQVQNCLRDQLYMVG